MKILVIGLGSMGKRRIRLLRANYKNITIIGVDTKAERQEQVYKLYGIKSYSDLKIAINSENPTAAIICTAPISHADIILECLNNDINIFTEINLVDEKYKDIMHLSNKKGLVLFLSSTFLYRKEIQFIKSETINKKNITYRYHVGQYLPDWHPWEHYKDFFVGDKRTNGCREIFAIELPWIIDTFGEIENIYTIKNKVTSLDISYCDTYSVIVTHKNGHCGTLNFDIVSRKAIRSFEMYNEDIHVFWDGTPGTLRKFNLYKKDIEHVQTYEYIDKDENYSENIIENAYLEELNAFISSLNGNKSLEKYSFDKDLYTLSIIDKIEGDE